jgi:hypothetical protein
LQTVPGVKWNTNAAYTGDTPIREPASVMENWEFTGWSPEPVNVTVDMDCHAQFKNTVSMARMLVSGQMMGTYKNDRVTTVGSYAFYGFNHKDITCVDFLHVSYIANYAFCGYQSKLSALIIRKNDNLCVLGGTNALNSSVYIYVPAALIEDYKVATNWSTYANQFRALEDYTVDGTITGDLDEAKIRGE